MQRLVHKVNQKRSDKVNIIHIMKDGSVRDSIEGMTIQNPEFYQVLKNIQEKKVRGEQ